MPGSSVRPARSTTRSRSPAAGAGASPGPDTPMIRSPSTLTVTPARAGRSPSSRFALRKIVRLMRPSLAVQLIGGEQLLVLRAHLVDVGLAHLLEPSHVLGQARDLDRDVEVARREAGEQTVERRLVVAAQLPLEPAVRGHAEHVERRTAQSLGRREPA